MSKKKELNLCFSCLFTYVSTYYILTFILNNLKNWICVFLCCIFAVSIKQIKNNNMKNLTSIKTNEVIIDFKETSSNYLVKCDTPKYATHTDEAGNYYCMYGTFAAFDGEKIIKFNNK